MRILLLYILLIIIGVIDTFLHSVTQRLILVPAKLLDFSFHLGGLDIIYFAALDYSDASCLF